MKQVLLMALSGDEYIACWEIDPENGALTKIAETRVLGRPAPLVLDVENFIQYVGLRRPIPYCHNISTSAVIDFKRFFHCVKS